MSAIQPSSPAGWHRSFLAGVLSLFLPGLGQIFAGSWRLGVRLYAIFSLGGVIILVGLTRVASPTPPATIAFIAFAVIFGLSQVAIAVDAARRVRRGYDRSRRPWYRSTVLAAAIMLTLNGVLASNVGWQSFNVASGSNMPTLVVGDYMMADARSRGSTPVAGEMIVFRPTRSPQVYWVKRVVGLPGDRVQLRRGVLFLNGQEVRREAADEYSSTAGRRGHGYLESLANGRRYFILKLTDDGPANNTPEYVVPPGKLFVLGDNRDDSIDSRHPQAMGEATIADVTGPVRTIYWSRDWSRILTPIN